MDKKTKQLLICVALPLTTAIIAAIALSCCNKQNNSQPECTCDQYRTALIIDSLLRENNRLQDSLLITKDRLDDCETNRNKRCPRDTKPKDTTKPKPKPKDTTKPAQSNTEQKCIKVENNNNCTIVIGNNNTIANDNTIRDTLTQAKTVRHTISAYSQSSYTYTK